MRFELGEIFCSNHSVVRCSKNARVRNPWTMSKPVYYAAFCTGETQTDGIRRPGTENAVGFFSSSECRGLCTTAYATSGIENRVDETTMALRCVALCASEDEGSRLDLSNVALSALNTGQRDTVSQGVCVSLPGFETIAGERSKDDGRDSRVPPRRSESSGIERNR